MNGHESGSIRIEQPLENVWCQLTTLDELTTWYDGWDECEHDVGDQRMRAGLTFRLISTHALRATAACRVVTVAEPELLRWIEHRPLHAPVLVEFRLAVEAPRTTTVSHTKTVGRLHRAPRAGQ